VSAIEQLEEIPELGHHMPARGLEDRSRPSVSITRASALVCALDTIVS
jgi:hypothetical protein